MNTSIHSFFSIYRNWVLCLLLVLFLPTLPTNLIAGNIETAVIDLKSRTAEELIPLIRPHLPKISLSGRGYQLIARGSIDDLESLKYILQQLDKTLQRLRITVDFSGGKYSDGQGASASGKISNQDSHVTVKTYGTQNREDSAQLQNILLLEGQAGYIRSGISVPVGRSLNYQNGYPYNRESQVQYRDVITGVHVLPLLQDNQITLYVTAVRGDQKQYKKVFTTQAAETVLRGQLGEWILLGGVSQSGTSDSTGSIYSTRSRGEQFGNIRLRVDAE